MQQYKTAGTNLKMNKQINKNAHRKSAVATKEQWVSFFLSLSLSSPRLSLLMELETNKQKKEYAKGSAAPDLLAW